MDKTYFETLTSYITHHTLAWQVSYGVFILSNMEKETTKHQRIHSTSVSKTQLKWIQNFLNVWQKFFIINLQISRIYINNEHISEYLLYNFKLLAPHRRQAIIWDNAGILLIGPLETNFSEILIKIQTFSLKKIRLKMSSAKCCSLRLSLNELKAPMWFHHHTDMRKVTLFCIHCSYVQLAQFYGHLITSDHELFIWSHSPGWKRSLNHKHR